MAVDQPMIDAAMDALGVEAVSSLRDGGQKTVRLVRDGERQLVLKVVAIDSSYPDALKRSQREVDLLQQIDSPHLVKVASDLVELGDQATGVAWLEEYLDGRDLSELLSQRWSPDETIPMAKDVAAGLAAMHAKGFVHRDLSANNVRRLASGGFVVMDPGFARHTFRSTITVGGQPGTPGYASPEHLGGYSGAPTAASDVFCVGILMFKALTGELPIPMTGDQADYVARLANVQTQSLSDFRTDVPDPLRLLVERCLHPQPARRPRNGARLLAALETL